MKDSEIVKEAQVSELTKQCKELIQSRTIQMNLVMNKKPVASVQAKKDPVETYKPPKESKKSQGKKGSTNLQLAMELNREMEEMFAESGMGLETKPTKKTKKKQTKQVQFTDGPDQKSQ